MPELSSVTIEHHMRIETWLKFASNPSQDMVVTRGQAKCVVPKENRLTRHCVNGRPQIGTQINRRESRRGKVGRFQPEKSAP